MFIIFKPPFSVVSFDMYMLVLIELFSHEKFSILLSICLILRSFGKDWCQSSHNRVWFITTALP